MLADIVWFLVGLAIVGVVYGLSKVKRGAIEMDRERLRKHNGCSQGEIRTFE